MNPVVSNSTSTHRGYRVEARLVNFNRFHKPVKLGEGIMTDQWMVVPTFAGLSEQERNTGRRDITGIDLTKHQLLTIEAARGIAWNFLAELAVGGISVECRIMAYELELKHKLTELGQVITKDTLRNGGGGDAVAYDAGNAEKLLKSSLAGRYIEL